MDRYKHVEGQDMKTKEIVVQDNMEIYDGDKNVETGMKLTRSFVKLRPLTLLEWKLLNIDPVVKLTRIPGFDLSGCPGGIHALKFVWPTQD